MKLEELKTDCTGLLLFQFERDYSEFEGSQLGGSILICVAESQEKAMQIAIMEQRKEIAKIDWVFKKILKGTYNGNEGVVTEFTWARINVYAG